MTDGYDHLKGKGFDHLVPELQEVYDIPVVFQVAGESRERAHMDLSNLLARSALEGRIHILGSILKGWKI